MLLFYIPPSFLKEGSEELFKKFFAEAFFSKALSQQPADPFVSFWAKPVRDPADALLRIPQKFDFATLRSGWQDGCSRIFPSEILHCVATRCHSRAKRRISRGDFVRGWHGRGSYPPYITAMLCRSNMQEINCDHNRIYVLMLYKCKFYIFWGIFDDEKNIYNFFYVMPIVREFMCMWENSNE